MILQQYYLDCLSHASYLVGDETSGRAVVVDPQRDVSQYLEDAAAHGLTITKVIETHFHADFLSGHLELAQATGATIVYGDVAQPEFDAELLPHGARIELGEVVLEVLHTPGHTPESISVVVYEHPGDEVPHAVLTGDTLFIGDVGRPDLLASIGFTAEDLGRQLYHSLHEQLLTLPDPTRVLPAHGAGSACGRNLSTQTSSTIGEQRAWNYALRPMSEDEFVAVVTEGQPAAPGYFLFDATMNRKARELFDEGEATTPMAWDDVRAAMAGGAVLIDTRDDVAFAQGHLRGSLNVGLGGRFAEYSGEVVRHDQSIVLVCEPGQEQEAKVRLARIGFDRVLGHLDDPVAVMAAHPDDVERSSRLTVAALAEARRDLPDLQVVDVRNQGEIDANGAIEGSVVVPLPRLLDRVGELDPARPTVVVCAGGYRSSIAASVLRARGFSDVSDLLGGYTAWASSPPDVIAAGTGA